MGKHVNELRKKTSDAALAKRSKNLVRRWRNLILPDQRSRNNLNGDKSLIKIKNNNSVGDKYARPPLSRSKQSCSLISLTSKPNSPLRVVEKSISPVIGDFSSASNSPPVVRNRPFEGIGEADGLGLRNFKPISPDLNRPGVNSSSKRSLASPYQSCSQNNLEGQSRSPCITYSSNVNSPSRTCSPLLQTSHALLDLDRRNAANKKLRKPDGVNNSSNNANVTFSNSIHSPNISASLVNGLNDNCLSHEPQSNNNPNAIPRPPLAKGGRKRKAERAEPMDLLKKKLAVHAKSQKVKTTAQLIAELQARTDSPILKSCESMLFENQQNNERAVVEGNKNQLRYSALADSVAEVKKTKSELMEKFLRSSPSPLPDLRTDGLVQKESPVASPVPSIASQNNVDDASPSVPESVSDKLRNILSQLPDIDLAQDQIVLSDDYEPKPVVSPDDETVKRLHSDRWPEVNGNYSIGDNWSGWHEMTARKSHADDVLHILPYVNIDSVDV